MTSDLVEVSILVPREAYEHAQAMAPGVRENFRVTVLLANGNEQGVPTIVYPEGVLSVAAAIGINHLLRDYGKSMFGAERRPVPTALALAAEPIQPSKTDDDLGEDEKQVLRQLTILATRGASLDVVLQSRPFRKLMQRVNEEKL